MAARTTLTPAERRAWRGMVALHTVALRRIAQHLQRDSDLSPADFEVLVNLSKAPNGRIRAVDLGAAMSWEKSRLSKHVSRMEARGLVRREACKGDNRSTYVVLTKAGSEAYASAEPQHMARVIELFMDALSEQQIDEFARAAEAVASHVAALPEPNCSG